MSCHGDQFVVASWDREQKQIVGSIPLRITFSSITGLQFKKLRRSFSIRVSVFDVAFRQFIGRTCHCPPVEIDDKTEETRLEQSIYMHTSFNDASVILCFEAVLSRDKESESSVGWGIIPVFKADHGVRTTAPGVPQTLPVYKGSPRALLFMEEPIESNEYLERMPGCRLTYALRIHKPLLKVAHLLPVNVLFAASEAVPGVLEQPASSLRSHGYGDALRRPRPQKPVALVLDRLTVSFGPDAEAFEEELCRNLDLDRLRAHGYNLSVEENSRVCVAERRLKVGVHNGCTYLREPQIVHLTLRKTRDDRRKSVLSHGNKIKLAEMTEDVHLMVVFLLEYVVSSPLASVTDRKLSSPMSWTRSQTSTVVAARWASWKPFLSMDRRDVTLALNGGASRNPDRVMVFAPVPVDGELKFTFAIRKRRDSGSSEVTDSGPLKVAESNGGPSSLPLDLSPRRRASKQRAHRRSRSDGSAVSSAKMVSDDNDSRNLTSQEVVRVPCATAPYVPISQVPSHSHSSGRGLSRAAYARLYGAGIPPVLDREGKPPDVVNICDRFDLNLDRELHDPLKTNVIIFQFLAYSCRLSSGHDEFAQSVPKILKFSFQFFRFPPTLTDRMLVSRMEIDISSDPKCVPCLLQKVDCDGSARKGPIGYEVKFCVDRNFFEETDREAFFKYLAEQCIHVDVWDGESQLYIGSASAELKRLCRQGREAVQATYELDVRHEDSCEDAPSSGIVTKGCLHLRMANVGYPKAAADLQLARATDRKNLTPTRFYLEVDKKLARDLLRKDPEEVSDEGSRKIARMRAVRAARANERVARSPCWVDPDKDRLRKMERLRTVEAARERDKRDIITGLLFESFGKEVVLDAVPGEARFFEFDVVNPWKTPHTVTIECEDAEELRVVADRKELARFRSERKTNLTFEEDMFAIENGAFPKLFVGSRERVCVPFRYQCTLFECLDDFSGNADPARSVSRPRKSLRVMFRTAEGKTMSVLNVRVHVRLPAVDRVFHFHCAERSFVKRAVRIAPTARGNLSVLSSDPHVICEAAEAHRGDPVDILFKVSCGPCCSRIRFYLFVYDDGFQLKPSYCWLVVVHSLQRVDVTCVQDESRRQSLILRGSRCSRSVRCFPSHPAELTLEPADPFLLAAGAVHELQLTVNAKHVGTRYMYVNVVDVELHQVVDAWMVCVVCNPPALTRAFRIQLPLGGGRGSNKRLPFTNPYATRKKFFLRANRPDLLHFREPCFEVAPKQTYTLGLVFLPNFTAGQVDILVFINGEDERNEETFCVKANYA